MSTKGLKTLSIIFAILAVVTVIVLLTGNKKKAGNFQSVLANVESSDIDRIEISEPGEESFALIKSGDESWRLKLGNENYPADNSSVTALLSQATKIKVKQVVSKNEDSWANYHVNDSLGTILRLYNDDELVSGIVAGRVAFAQSRSPYQQQPEISSFIRPIGEDLVYSTETILSMTLDRGPEMFRNPAVIKINPDNLRNIRFIYPADSSFSLVKTDTIWFTEKAPADSASMAGYLSNLRNFNIRTFAQNSAMPGNPAVFELQLAGDNMEAISVKAWPGNAKNEYIAISTQNEGAIFKLNQSQFERLFKGKVYFVK